VGQHQRGVDTEGATATMSDMGDERALAEHIESMKDDVAAWGEPTEPVGGKRRSERRQRGAVISVRLSADELAELQAFANRRNLSLSGTLRAAALEAARSAAATAHPGRSWWNRGGTSVASVNISRHERIDFRVDSNVQHFVRAQR
jgi:hypothetical protein